MASGVGSMDRLTETLWMLALARRRGSLDLVVVGSERRGVRLVYLDES